MLTNLKVIFVGFNMKVLYYKSLIIKKAYTFSVIKYCKDYIDGATQTNHFLVLILARIK